MDISPSLLPSMSVIVSTYMQSGRLSCLLGSLMHQDATFSFEVVICDDGSSSESLAVVRHFTESTHLDIRYVWQPDRGFRLSRSRNNAIRCSRGDLLVFVDADTILSPDFLSCHRLAHSAIPNLVCGSRSIVWSSSLAGLDSKSFSSGEYEFLRSKSLYSTYENQVLMIYSQSPWAGIIGCNFSIPRIPEAYFDEQFVGWGCEDQEIAARLIFKHGFLPICPANLEVIHIEDGEPRPFSRMRPQNCDEINAYVRNLVHFCRLYSNHDMSIAWSSLRHYEYDAGTAMWRLRARPSEAIRISQLMGQANAWYDQVIGL
jgi:glycosyltransferase involved in cell wall biosynthesis